MAQPANLVDTYDAVNTIKESLEDVIYLITPEATPFFSRCQKKSISNTLHEWNTSSLRASTLNNSNIEGDETTSEARTQTTRLNNVTQILKNSVAVSDTDTSIDHAGRSSIMASEMLKVLKEQKLDVEKTLLSNQSKVSGNATTARKMAGAATWVTTNVNFVSASSGANPTGDGSDSRTDSGAPTAFTQAKFDAVMQSVWTNGGEPDTCYLNPFQMTKALAFVGNNNQRANVVADNEKVVNSLSVYLTPWGQISFQPSREVRASDVWIMQSDMWHVGVLRAAKNVALAKTGDSERRQITQELTMICANEAASGLIADNTTS
tara:strand:- start:1697 stop:2659 length:963 start_codon:yes stop_codon:yes gene_type:complete